MAQAHRRTCRPVRSSRCLPQRFDQRIAQSGATRDVSICRSRCHIGGNDAQGAIPGAPGRPPKQLPRTHCSGIQIRTSPSTSCRRSSIDVASALRPPRATAADLHSSSDASSTISSLTTRSRVRQHPARTSRRISSEGRASSDGRAGEFLAASRSRSSACSARCRRRALIARHARGSGRSPPERCRCADRPRTTASASSAIEQVVGAGNGDLLDHGSGIASLRTDEVGHTSTV